MSMNIIRLKGDRHWWGVDPEDRTLCRKTDNGPLTVVARFNNSADAVRFEEFLARVQRDTVIRGDVKDSLFKAVFG